MKYTEDYIKTLASNYTKRTDFKKGHAYAYKKAHKLGIIDKLIPLDRKPYGYWTESNVILEAKKYKTRQEFKKGCYSAFMKAYEFQMLNTLFPLLRRFDD